MENIAKLTVVLPAYNEEAAIGEVIDEIRSLPLEGVEILVVDNGSTDGTVDVVENRNVSYIHEMEKGKGLAMRAAFRHVKTPYVVMMDSDFTYPANFITDIVMWLQAGRDVVLCTRRYLQVGSMSKVNRFGNRVLSLLASVLYRNEVSDVCSGMWGFHKEALDRFDLTSSGFTFEADLFANACRRGCSMTEISIVYRARLNGSVAKLKVWDGFKIGWFLIKRRFR